MEDRVNMQDRPGEFQGLYVERLDKLKMELEIAHRNAKNTPNIPIQFAAFVQALSELTQTIEALGSYVTVLEEELRRRG